MYNVAQMNLLTFMGMSSVNEEAHSNNTSAFRARGLLKLFRLFGGGVLLWLFVRTFIVQGMYVPSDSMRNTLNPGDMIFVNKLVYGPRIPFTPLSIPFTDKYLTWIQLPYMRLPGYAQINLNDIIVFNLPVDKLKPVDCKDLYVKRCVGLPGDSLIIERGTFIVNGRALPHPYLGLIKYEVELNHPQSPDSLFVKLGVTPIGNSPDGIHYYIIASESDANRIKENEAVISINRITQDPKYYESRIFPQNSAEQYRWNADNFGPVIIPAAGRTVNLSLQNIHLYKNAIANHEGNTIEIQNQTILINGKPQNTYTFQLNYYFVAGDNRAESYDSRYFGFLPEDHIIGKVVVD
jgi:signal peptidase I